jgi:alkylation response protein AidB-like acyl-CoA dehydrogenase
VHFAFDEQQLEFRSQLRTWAEAHCTSADLRAAWESKSGWSPDRWRMLGELGVLGVTVPTEHGGLGLGLVDLALLLEEAGRSGLPEPVLESTAVAAPLLGQLRGEAGAELRARWLPALARGEAVLGVPSPGRPSLVLAGSDLVLVMVDGALCAVETAELSVRERCSIDGARHLLEVDLAMVPPASPVCGPEDGLRLWQAAADRGAWATAAVLVGVADRMITMAADYAKQRTQFGKPIGSFQAVKHHLAGALVRLEFARPLVYGAAWSFDESEPDAARRASMAKAAASDAANLAASVALQVHGAIGYTWEHDLHLWMKRAWSLAAAWGDAGWHRARLMGLVDW